MKTLLTKALIIFMIINAQAQDSTFTKHFMFDKLQKSIVNPNMNLVNDKPDITWKGFNDIPSVKVNLILPGKITLSIDTEQKAPTVKTKKKTKRKKKRKRRIRRPKTWRPAEKAWYKIFPWITC
jgi:hypothetical protein